MADVKDLLIRMSLDTSTFKRNIQTAKAELRTLKSEYKAVASSDEVGKAGEKLLSNLQEQKTVAEALVSEYNKGIQSLRNQLQKATPGSQAAFQIEQQIQKLEDGLARARTQVNNLQADIDGIKLDNFISKAETVASTFSSLRMGLGELLDGFGDAADSADSAFVSRESAWVGVTKILSDREGYTEEWGEALNKWNREVIGRIPVTYEALAEIEANALQAAGVSMEGLREFTETYAALQSATNIQGEAGVLNFGKYLTVMGTAEDEYHRIGSVVVAMGNNFASLEDQIVATAKRSASALRAAGFSAEDGLAMATAATALGMEEAAAATSLEKVIGKMAKAAEVGAGPYRELLDLYNTWQDDPQNIEKQMAAMAKFNELKLDISSVGKLEASAEALQKFARVLNMTGEEFTTAYNQDAAATVISFFDQLGRMNEEESEGLLTYLDTLGITEIRAARMARNFALNADTVGDALNIARQAYAEDKALDEEAARRYATNESRRTMNQNKEQNALEAMGETVTAMRKPWEDFFADVKQGFAEMPGWVQTAAGLVTQGLGSLGDALETAGKLSLSVVSIANAVRELSGTALGAAILKKIVGLGGTALSVTPYAALAVGGNYLFSELDKASTEKNWGEYNRTQEALDTYLTENVDERVTRMQALLAGFSQAMSDFALNEDPMSDRTESLKNVFRQYANDLLREMPDLNIWKQMADSVNLSDGLDDAEIEKIIGSMEFADQWLELGNQAVTGLANGIKDREAELQSAASAAAQETVDAAKDTLGVQSPSTVFFGIGLNVDAGLAEGIIAGADQAIAAASWLAGQIEETLRVDLDIHSPSGVARALGGYFAEGFAQGIENGVSRVEGSMDRLTKAVTPKLDGNGNPVSREVRVTVNMDGKAMAQALAPMMDTALGDLSWDL